MAFMNIRVAIADDAPRIFELLVGVAPEIPLRLDTDERREAVAAMLSSWITLGESMVALDGDGLVVGFLMVEPNMMRRFLEDDQSLHLPYAGVAHSHRNRGIFRALILQAKGRNVPLTATVKSANQSETATRLTRMGFQICVSSADEWNLVWRPEGAQPSAS
jgi:ribosomal protein S18 acetylase RimI-like enzyme